MRYTSIIILGCLLIGCSGAEAPPETVPVNGQVTYKNEPLTKGKVALHPTAKAEEGAIQRPSTGQIGEGGKFTLSTFKTDDGVMPGEYKITVESYEKELTMEELGEGKKQKSLIPEKYRRLETTDLTATIPEQDEPYPLKIELKD